MSYFSTHCDEGKKGISEYSLSEKIFIQADGSLVLF